MVNSMFTGSGFCSLGNNRFPNLQHEQNYLRLIPLPALCSVPWRQTARDQEKLMDKSSVIQRDTVASCQKPHCSVRGHVYISLRFQHEEPTSILCLLGKTIWSPLSFSSAQHCFCFSPNSFLRCSWQFGRVSISRKEWAVFSDLLHYKSIMRFHCLSKVEIRETPSTYMSAQNIHRMN